MSKKILCVFISIVMLFAIVSTTVYASDITYKQGDIIEFGSYPQSKVTDESVINELNDLELEYVEVVFTSESVETYVEYKYADAEYNNEKYRAVCTAESETVSWFKYEPIKWEIIDPDTGYVFCSNILDYQLFDYDGGEWDSSDIDWETSDIRAWLNDSFYNTAFSAQQQNSIILTDAEVKFTDYYGNVVSTKTVADNIALFTLEDARDENLGFFESESGFGWWETIHTPALLRSETEYFACINADTFYFVALKSTCGCRVWAATYWGFEGHCDVSFHDSYRSDFYGIAPTMHINLETFDKEQIPGDMDSNGEITAADARTALRIAASLEPATDEMRAVADINNDGQVTAADARTILRISAGLE